MEYESTIKLFFKLKPNEFKNELDKRVNSLDTLKLDFYIDKNQSFFHYDRFIFNKLISVETKNVTLNAIFNSLPPIAKQQYIRNTLIA